MSRFELLACLFLAACGAQRGDLTGDDEPIACTQTTDCPADEVCEGGVCVTEPLEELVVEIVDNVIHDERGDAITFGAGHAPRHDHVGEPITLGGSGCPEVHKYSYLMDPEPPAIGGEVAPNPLAWRFAVRGADLVAAEYRIRTEAGTRLDWTTAEPDGEGLYTIPVYRSGPHGIPELQSIAQAYTIDFRARDDAGREATVTGCWEHRPLAPPVQVTSLAASAAPDALARFLLAAGSPVSRLLEPSSGVTVFEHVVFHATAEPVTLQLELPVPSGTFTRRAVNDLLPEPSVPANVFCGILCRPNSPCIPEPATDPKCSSLTPIEPSDPVTTGTLGEDTWTVRVIDVVTGQAASECAVTGRRVTCSLPGRPGPNQEKALLVQLRASGHAELEPPPGGVMGEHVFQSRGYTGLPITERKFKCNSMTTSSPNEFGEMVRTCRNVTSFARLIALDQLVIDFAAPSVAVKTAIPSTGALPATELAAPPTGGVLAGTGFRWDSGNDDLPGLLH